MKAKSYPLLPQRVQRSRWVQNPLTILCINWWFQGMRGMGRKELSFRLLVELAVTLALAWVLETRSAAGLLFAWALAHTLNFTLNGQLWVCARYAPRLRVEPARIRRFLERLAARLDRIAWLDEAVVLGSLPARGLMPGAGSDIDLRLVFPPGLRGWLRLNLLLLGLRSWALLARVPLDLYGADDLEALSATAPGEPWLVLLDRRGRIARRFGGTRELVRW